MGISSTDASASKGKSTAKLSESLQSGWNASASVTAGFMGSGVTASGGGHSNSSSSISGEYEASKEIASTANSDQSVTQETTCTPKGTDLGSGLWQWIITTEDYSVSAFTPHTVCRTGANAYIPPECPFWDCLNGDCSKCRE